MIRFTNMTFYTFYEVFRGVMWINGTSRKSIIRHNNQRDSSYLPRRFDHRTTVETGGKVPAQNGPHFDMPRPRGVRSRVAWMACAGWQIDISRGLGNLRRRSALRTPHATTDGGLCRRDTTGPRARTYDARTTRAQRVAGMDRRDARLTTSRYIKSRDNLNASQHNISSQGGQS